MEQRQHEPEVGRNRCLAREHELDLVLDGHVPVVDLVVERDHLVAQLDVLRAQGVDGAANRPGGDVAELLEARLQGVEVGLQLGSHPNLPVT